MPLQKRPDGSLRLDMHVPLWQTAVVLLACFGMGGYFFHAGTQPHSGASDFHGMEYSLPPDVWRIAFFVTAAVLLGAGLFILLGLLRGGKPHVKIESRRIVVAGMAMAGDKAMRWDEVESVKRSRIMHGASIALKSRTGKKLQLSEHTFRNASDFRALCAQIESHAAQAQAQRSSATSR